eukprot:3612733-Pleurochrysis_carterae.AAC.2
MCAPQLVADQANDSAFMSALSTPARPGCGKGESMLPFTNADVAFASAELLAIFNDTQQHT